MIDDGHLEVVEGGHQIVQFGSGGGGAGCVGKHRGVGVSGGLNLFLVQYLLFLYFFGTGDSTKTDEFDPSPLFRKIMLHFFPKSPV